VIKTILQTRGVSEDEKVKRTRGFVDAFKIIRERNGYRGFFRGVLPRLMTHVPSTAICWTTYEFIKMCLLQERNANNLLQESNTKKALEKKGISLSVNRN
jgi:solute carrier family 25 iron transporter 28/37